MKFEKITDAKIKIFLDINDMQLHNVSSKTILDTSSSSQKLLQNLLTIAEQEIGFNTGDSKLLVEAIMSSEEECIFTITKLTDTDLLKKTNNSFIFKFENFDNFLSLCSLLNNLSDLDLKDFSKDFSLVLYNNTYYLCNKNANNYLILLDYMKEIFSEFGTNVSDSFYVEGLLNEYGKVLFKNNAIINCIFYFI